jgi:hypothetical protein
MAADNDAEASGATGNAEHIKLQPWTQRSRETVS